MPHSDPYIPPSNEARAAADEAASKKVERAANNVFLLLVARWMMAAVVPAFMAILASAIGWLVTATNDNTKTIIKLEQRVQLISDTIVPSVIQLLNSRIDVHADRLGSLEKKINENAARDEARDLAQDARIDKLLDKIDRLLDRK